MSASKKEREHQYAEGFCLMLYQGRESKRVVDIWNSRNGVTPFTCVIEGEEYAHIAFSFDRKVPEHKLRPGDYFFRGMTQDEATRLAALQTDRFIRAYPDEAPKDEAERLAQIEQVAREYWHNGEAPMLDRAPFIQVVDHGETRR